MTPLAVPTERIRPLNDAPIRPERAFVLYWMTAARRLRFNSALDRAVGLAAALRRPLVILEPLRVDYPWASDRLHAFVIAGMAENRRRLARRAVHYHPWVEAAPGDGKGLVAAFGRHACAVVGDDFPASFLPRALAAAAAQLDVRLEAVDSNGLLPIRLGGGAFATAHAFRRFAQRTLPAWLDRFPAEDPLAGARLPRLAALPGDLVARWPAASPEALEDPARLAAALPVDHGVAPAGEGGAAAASRRLRAFLDGGLDRYAEARSDPDAEATSGLSPWLHFGQLSVHEVVRELLRREGWTPDALAPEARGARAGWWGLTAGAEAFLDQLVTWRELGHHAAAAGEDPASPACLPAWARATLARHRRDPRPHRYALEELEAAQTHDPIWNAAQRQLRAEGVIPGYLRMIWGKRILEWTRDAGAALRTLIDLNDRWALDGRDPNSYSGIHWCLGRYDRPWGPERPIFGTVRYMSSERARAKLAMDRWLARWGEGGEAPPTRRRGRASPPRGRP